MIPKPQNCYKTSDLYYAAFLKISGVPFVGTSKDERRIYFLFEDIEAIGALKMGYFNRSLKVIALTLADEVKAMKAMIFSVNEQDR